MATRHLNVGQQQSVAVAAEFKTVMHLDIERFSTGLPDNYDGCVHRMTSTCPGAHESTISQRLVRYRRIPKTTVVFVVVPASATVPFASSGAEIRGRCEHPFVVGSGTGGFKGATGRVDMKDDVVNGVALFRGHIKLAS